MTKPPCQDLYIYELEGDARAHVPARAPGYLGLWPEGEASFVFFSAPAGDAIREMLASAPGLRLVERHELTYEQWQGGLELEPIPLPGLWVVPSWLEAVPPPGTKLLRLDPGLVFGSGFHPTTLDSLKLLLARAGKGPLGKVMDLGCGTGILGLAATLLGASSVLAVDLNPLCVETTRKNAALNLLGLEAREGSALDFIASPADLLLANLHWEVHRKLLAVPQALTGKKDLILSGITRSWVGKLEDRLLSLGYTVYKILQADNTWFTLWAAAKRR